MTRAQIRLERVSKAYRPQGTAPAVLDGVEAEIAAGEFAVLLGRSGSGKSTLLNLIGAIDLPTSGEVYLDGIALSSLGERERALLRRKRLGFVFQSYNLIPTLTAGENLLLPLELNGVTGAAAAARMQAMLEEIGLGGCAARFPEELSGGEQQRVAIARALIHRPEIILADEPTGNLDLDTATMVVALLNRLCRAGHCTLVMATHSPEVLGLADRVLTIRAGRLIEAPR